MTAGGPLRCVRSRSAAAPLRSGCVPLSGPLALRGIYCRGNKAAITGGGRSKFKFKMLSSFKMKSNGNQEKPVNTGPEIKP